MNYYDHHIGDYATSLQYHSWDEDMAYTRMIRWYYAKEKPLPGDPAEVCRQIGARSEQQQQAVAVILADFFHIEADGYHNDKCDAVIAAFHAGEPERAAKKKNEETRVERHRRERSELFAVLNGAGEHMPWNVAMGELRAAVKRIQDARPATAPETGDVTGSVSGGQNSVSGGVTGGGAEKGSFSSENIADEKPATQPVTAPATPATATHTPVPSTHTPVSLIQEPKGSLSTSGKPTVADLQAGIDRIQKTGYQPPACPHEQILKLWRELLPELPQHVKWTDKRRKLLQARWRETAVDEKWTTPQDGMHYFAKLFRWVAQSKFLTGKVPPTPGRTTFVIELEWLINSSNWVKVIEGKYHTEE